MIYRLLIVLFFAISRFAIAAPIVLEESVISEKDQNAARDIRNNTKAPNSWVGSAAESVAKAAAEAAEACRHGECNNASFPSSKNVGSSGKQFKCEYSCASSGNFLYSGGSTKASTTTVSAIDKYEAEKMIEKSLWGNETCKGMKSSGGLSLVPKAVCRE